jgi:hypothetical protein
MRAAVAYWHLTGDAPTAVPALLPHVECSPRGLEAVRCLGLIGPPAMAAVPVLREAIASPYRQGNPEGTWSMSEDAWGRGDDMWRAACAEALARITAAP